jgi:hypothetical protein
MKCDEFTTPIKIEIPGIGTIESKDLLLKVEVDEAISELKETQRWRKCSEEKPEKGQKVLFLAKYKTDKVREWIGDFRHIDGMKLDYAVFYASAPGWGCEFLIDEVIGWMPLPSAPKEVK